MAKTHLTIALRDGVPVPLCGQRARNIHSTSSISHVTCGVCQIRWDQYEDMPILERHPWLEKIVWDWYCFRKK